MSGPALPPDDPIQVDPRWLIYPDEVQDRWPEWETYCSVFSDKQPIDALVIAITDASIEFNELLPSVTSETITDALKRHVLHMVKKEAFDFMHGDTNFERTPQIVKDYRQTLKTLERYRTGDLTLPGDTTEHFSMTAKRRQFNDWFTDQTDYPHRP